MTTLSVLVDLANTTVLRGLTRPNPPLVGDRIDGLIERVAEALATRAGAGFLEYRFRFYDGWFDAESVPTPVHRLVRPHLTSAYPTRGRESRILAEVAEGPLGCRPLRLPHTHRVEAGLPRISLLLSEESPANCRAFEECALPDLRVWLKGRCPRATANCEVRLNEIVSHRRQKLVDTLIVADLVWLATQGTPVAVVSDDEDVIPGLLVAGNCGVPVFWLCRDGSPRPAYRTAFAGSGVECLEC